MIQRRCRDPLQNVAYVTVRKRLAAGDVAVRVNLEESVACRLDAVGMVSPEGGCEEPVDNGLADCRHAAGTYGFDPIGPPLGRTDACGSVRDGEGLYAMRVLRSDPQGRDTCGSTPKGSS